MEVRSIAISSIRCDGGTQPRESVNETWVEEFAEDIRNGAIFDAVIVYYDGTDNWLADGFHRLHAHALCGRRDIAADIRQGTRLDAVLHSVGANSKHGNRRTNADKRRAVLRLLEDAKWGTWTDAEIARRCRVSHTFVADTRRSSRCVVTNEQDDPIRQYESDGHGPLLHDATEETNRKATDLQREKSEFEDTIAKISRSASSIASSPVKTADCLEYLHSMQDQSIDVVVTSPPYNLDIDYHSYEDKLSRTTYLNWLAEVCTEIRRVMKPYASFFLNIGSSNIYPWTEIEVVQAICELRELFRLQNHIIWVKSIAVDKEVFGHFKPINSPRFLNHNHEAIYHLTINGDVPIDRLAIGVPFKDKSNIERRDHAEDVHCLGNTWFIPYETVQSKLGKSFHPASFPVALPEQCIKLHGVREGMIVLDPFAGTGSTLVAAKQLGCAYLGIEMDEHYANVARERLDENVD